MLSIHPFAEIFPPMNEEEIGGFIEDIKANGLREPLILFEGQVLDGRNRYRACVELGIEPMTRAWDGKGDPFDYVISKNLHRRHLTTSQRSMVTKSIAKIRHGGHRHGEERKVQIYTLADKAREDVAIKEAAKLMNVSVRSVKHARVVSEKGIPELEAMVMAGKVSVSAASEVAKMPESKQRELVASGPKAIVAAAKKKKRRRPNGAGAAAANYTPETEHERNLRILRSCWECTCPSAKPEFLEDVADEIRDYQLLGTPDEICEAILSHLGVDQAKKVARALDKRLRNVKPDCLACGGTGFAPAQFSTACGMPIGSGKIPCDCSPAMQGLAKKTVCVDLIEEVPPNHVDEHRAA
jgi:hypothetical protein